MAATLVICFVLWNANPTSAGVLDDLYDVAICGAAIYRMDPIAGLRHCSEPVFKYCILPYLGAAAMVRDFIFTGKDIRSFVAIVSSYSCKSTVPTEKCKNWHYGAISVKTGSTLQDIGEKACKHPSSKKQPINWANARICIQDRHHKHDIRSCAYIDDPKLISNDDYLVIVTWDSSVALVPR
jgi:hypothetical protein